MMNVFMTVFLWVTFITFKYVDSNHKLLHPETTDTCREKVNYFVGWTHENANWVSVKNGDELPNNVTPVGEEKAKDGTMTATYIARAAVPKFAQGIFPGYYSTSERKAVITGVVKGPHYMDEFEILTSKPKWERVTDGGKLPFRIMPVGYYIGKKAPEPVYTCRGYLDEGERIGVLWWGTKYCHVMGDNGETGSYTYDVLVV